MSKTINLFVVISLSLALISMFAFILLVGINNLRFAPNDQGTAQVFVGSNAQIDTLTSFIDFGAGFVNPGAGTIMLYSNSTAGNNLNWINASNGSAVAIADEGFIIENTGNIDLEIGVQLEDSMDTWLPPGPSLTSATLDYMYRGCDTTAPIAPLSVDNADCSYATGNVLDDTDFGCEQETGHPGPGIFIILNQTLDDVCGGTTGLGFDDTQDEMRIDLRLTLPEDITPTGGSPRTNRVVLDIVAI